MNNNLSLLTYLLTPNKKSKLFNFNNYYWKLNCILDFNNYNINKSKKNLNRPTYYNFYFNFLILLVGRLPKI
jgi:hypothetical protein